jgi:hypothetical protein
VLKLKQKLGGFDLNVEPLKSPLMFFKRRCRFHHGGMLVKIEVVFQDPFFELKQYSRVAVHYCVDLFLNWLYLIKFGKGEVHTKHRLCIVFHASVK